MPWGQLAKLADLFIPLDTRPHNPILPLNIVRFGGFAILRTVVLRTSHASRENPTNSSRVKFVVMTT